MIKKVYQFTRGVLIVRIYGRNIMRLLNLCIRSGIKFWDMECVDACSVRMRMYLGDIYRIRPFLRKTHVRLYIEARLGLPFLLSRYRARKVFALIFLAMIGAVAVLSTRIWRIEIVGNSSIGEETFIEYLGEKKICCGAAKSAVDNDALELSLRQDFEPVIWASVYEKGTKLVVSVQEKLAAEQKENLQGVCTDLVADRDAKIVSIITRSGTPMVSAGDEVSAGDILVCGRQEILDDSGEVREYYYRSADADVRGAVIYDYEDWIPQSGSIKKRTGNQKERYYVTFGTWRLTIPSFYADYDDFECVEDVKQFVLTDSFYLPVYFGHITQIELETVDFSRSKEEIKALAIEHLEQFLSDLEENGVSISGKNVMIEKTDGVYHIYGEILATESIVKREETKVLPQPSEKKTTEEELQE